MEDEELLAWLYIRDLLFGRNFLKQDVVSAYRLSASCAHPDARFVFEALGRKPEDRIDAHNLLLKNGAPDCARTFWFCQMLLVDPYSSDTDCDEPEEDVRPNFDFPFALALQAGMSSRELGFEVLLFQSSVLV
jgi:hypothetical protein